MTTAIASPSPILVDSSIVVRLFDRSSPAHAPAVDSLRILGQRKESLRTCAQVHIESYAVMTRQLSSNGLGLSQAKAINLLDQVRTLMPCVEEPADIETHWRRVVENHTVIGRQAHDARLAALMAARQWDRILTLNAADFRRYTAIQVLTPQDVIGAAP